MGRDGAEAHVPGDGLRPAERARLSILARLVLLPIYAWRAIAPLRTPRCKFYPSCSAYAVEAIRRYGALRGGWMALRRLVRCHPWSVGGVDHVK